MNRIEWNGLFFFLIIVATIIYLVYYIILRYIIIFNYISCFLSACRARKPSVRVRYYLLLCCRLLLCVYFFSLCLTYLFADALKFIMFCLLLLLYIYILLLFLKLIILIDGSELRDRIPFLYKLLKIFIS